MVCSVPNINGTYITATYITATSINGTSNRRAAGSKTRNLLILIYSHFNNNKHILSLCGIATHAGSASLIYKEECLSVCLSVCSVFLAKPLIRLR